MPNQMYVARYAVRLALVVLALSVLGCDPGYNYQPVDAKGERLTRWSEAVEGVRFSARQYSTLIGSRNTVVYLDINNEANKEVVVSGGQLLSNGRTIEARVNDDLPDREARTIPAGDSKSVLLYWEFGGASSDVLGPDITWIWRVRIGNTEHSLRVPMNRQKR